MDVENHRWHVLARHAILAGMLKLWLVLFPVAMLAPGASVQAGNLLDQLPQNGIQSAFQILRRDYIRREDLSYEELNRAALQGLLERLDFGAELVPAASEPAAVAPYVHAEFLAPDVAYIRPETFAAGEGALFETALTGLVEKKARHLILDLRAGGRGDFQEAAAVLQCFWPQGELMFKMKQLNSDEAELFISKRAPLWTGAVVVLVDEETGHAAETVAAALEKRGMAFLVGAKTKGATVAYTKVKLDDRALLRYASAEMLLTDGTSHFKSGLTPRHTVVADPKEKHRVFAESRGKSHLPFVSDRVRPRFNEKALVHRYNPELDDYVRKSSGQALPGDAGQVRDVVTQRALDLLEGSDLVRASRINWDEKVEADELPAEFIPKAIPAQPAQP